VDTITITDYLKMIETKPLDTATAGLQGYAVGKIADSYNWYIACEIDNNTLHNFTSGKSYDVIYPYSNDKEIKSTLYRIITEPNSERVILIFKCGTVTDSFNFLRRQTVEIVQSSYSGYRVPISAVRIVNGVKGVFILSGSVIRFREIEPLFEKNGYLIVTEKDLTSPEQKNRLGLYEMIITKGGNYYDGQIVK
jgi:hypothetical protein